MFEIIKYYQSRFPIELNQYCEHRLENQKIKDFFGIRNIQVLRIADGLKNYGDITPYQPLQKEAFFICLYFIVLTDLAVYTHFKQFYIKFEEKTMFPKVMYGFNAQPAPPYITLDQIGKNDFTTDLYRSLAHFFIKEEWSINLPKICNVHGLELMKKILSDSDFASFGNNKLELILASEIKDVLKYVDF